MIGAISRKGNVVARVLGSVDAWTAKSFVREVVASDVSLIATDQAPSYKAMKGAIGDAHQSVDHSSGEYVRGIVHTANIDSFWSLLKRGIMGSFHHVSKEYLPMYINEFTWRYNHRSDEDIFRAVLAGC